MRACCQCRGGGLHPWRRRSPRAAEQLTPRHNHLKPAHPGLCSAREAPGLHQQRKLAKARKTQQQPKTTKFKKRKTDIVKQLHSNKNLKINTTAPQKSQFSKTLSNESYRHPHTHTHTHTRARNIHISKALHIKFQGFLRPPRGSPDWPTVRQMPPRVRQEQSWPHEGLRPAGTDVRAGPRQHPPAALQSAVPPARWVRLALSSTHFF